MTLRSATSAVFSPFSAAREADRSLRATTRGAGGPGARTPRAQLVLTSMQVLTCVCPCAGGNRHCSSHFARGSGVCSCRRAAPAPLALPGSAFVSALLALSPPPASPARGTLGICTPGVNPRGLTMPSAFPVDGKTRDYEVRKAVRSRSGERPSQFW